MLLTDAIYFAVSTFSLLFHCQNEKSEKKEETTEKVQKERREGRR